LPTYVVHYSEIALKGRNRPEFLRALRHNLQRALHGLSPEVSLHDGRFLVEAEGDPAETGRRLSTVFGVVWFAPVTTVSPSYDDISAAVLAQAQGAISRSFKIEARRADKSFQIGSQELARRLGAEVAERTGKGVDLRDPGVVIHADVLRGRCLVYSGRSSGPGGLPVGTAGRVMHLFSGGIDSPVAAWLLMKRGCRPVYVHFYLAPGPDYPLDSKITRLVRALSDYGGKSSMVLVPFAEYQAATIGAPAELEPSLFRRFMRMTAEALAPSFGASGIATGDSLSQAASQTIWNLAAFDEGASLPIFRPLLTYDKEEIVTLARSIGTYDASLEEYKDCCAIVTRHPRTRAKASLISALAKKLEFAALVGKSIDLSTMYVFNPATGESRAAPLAAALRRGDGGEGQARGSPGAAPTVSSA
jgi:tRNA uracil 4-sulfurtransferase